jgi:hypothetical protein
VSRGFIGGVEQLRISLYVPTSLVTIALELENLGVGPTPSPFWNWTAFNDPNKGADTDLCGAFKFAVVIDGRVLVDTLSGTIYQSLKERISDNKLQLSQEPTGFWNYDRAVVAFAGALVEACTFLWFTHNLNCNRSRG